MCIVLQDVIVSSFYGHGKRSALKCMHQYAGQFSALSTFGMQDSISCSSNVFFGALYGKMSCNSLNSLRCEKAQLKVPPWNLPSTYDSFNPHLKRVLRQCVRVVRNWYRMLLITTVQTSLRSTHCSVVTIVTQNRLDHRLRRNPQARALID